jgi:glutamine cyclotransferase
VTGWIDLTGILDAVEVGNKVDVLNGIAYDAAKDRLFVTGKFWPWLFEIEVVPSR